MCESVHQWTYNPKAESHEYREGVKPHREVMAEISAKIHAASTLGIHGVTLLTEHGPAEQVIYTLIVGPVRPAVPGRMTGRDAAEMRMAIAKGEEMVAGVDG